MKKLDEPRRNGAHAARLSDVDAEETRFVSEFGRTLLEDQGFQGFLGEVLVL